MLASGVFAITIGLSGSLTGLADDQQFWLIWVDIFVLVMRAFSPSD
jgi:hypothetical protein